MIVAAAQQQVNMPSEEELKEAKSDLKKECLLVKGSGTVSSLKIQPATTVAATTATATATGKGEGEGEGADRDSEKKEGGIVDAQGQTRGEEEKQQPKEGGGGKGLEVIISIEAPEKGCRVDVPSISVVFTVSLADDRSLLLRDRTFTLVEVRKLENPQLPSKMLLAMSREILAYYERLLVSTSKKEKQTPTSSPSSSSNKWRLQAMVDLIKLNYNAIVSSSPESLEWYMGEGDDGESVRRWAVLEEIIIPEHQDSEEEEDEMNGGESDESDDSNSEEEGDDEEAREYWRKKKEDEIIEEMKRRAREAEERRLEAERDPALFQKMKKLSVKEQQELKEAKNKQGVRLSKTGPRRKKFAGEGSAAEKSGGK